MKFIVYLLTLFMVGTAVAQNPTILQGNYITNVFGQSNFVLNPNARTDVLNVTNATRSTTTPLVATSEFTLSLTSGTNATWTLRAFDQGMKGQNCEARFSYRGFATATTKAELVQNSLVVASLTLTPSTDPRIASINFPCGDLTNLTTFRIAQTTANMTGTNEIGGIYVGLATNQANVAQAELVGTWKMTGTTNCVFNTSSLTYGSPSNYTTADADCNNPTVTGDLTSIGKVPGFSFTAKPGRYYIVATASFRKTNATTSDAKFRLTDGTNVGPSAIIYTSTAEEIISSFDTSYNIEISSVTSKTIYLDGVVGNAAETASIQNTDSLRQIYFQVYRFPTSSELVVTPERQNVFAGAQWSGTKGFQRANTTEITVSDTVYSTNRSLFGKAQFTGTANDLAITVPAMPPGTYKVELSSNYLSAQRVSTGTGDFGCQFTLKDNSGVVATSAAAQYGVQYSINSITVVSAVTTYTSVADRTFTAYLQSANAASTVDCYVSAPKIIITPLDQPSNSALYVQGPVQASATGATIAASYIGEVVTNASDATNTASGTTRNCGTLTLQPGVWDVYATQGTDFVVTNPNVTKIIVSISTTTGTLGTGIDKLTIPMPATAALGFGAYTVGPKRVNITSATPYYCVSQITASGNVDYVNSQLKAVRVN